MDAKRILWIGPLSRPTEAPPAWIVQSRTPEAALNELRHGTYDAIVLDFPIPGWTPDRLLGDVQLAAPGLPVLIRDPRATLPDAVRLARLGVFQCLGPGDDLAPQVELAIEERRTRDLARLATSLEWEQLLVGDSPQMRRVGHIIRMVGGRRSTVLITGETGTGKEVAARALHLAGPRRRSPLVAVNCSALPENLLEAELFGHVRGAFTGAVHNRVGRFEQAHGGTLFLDEVGDLAPDLQAKLLRVLQEREFQRLGSSETVHVDIRVIAATNGNLPERIRQGRFREDLYYRLNVVPIEMPPLRQRRADIPLLARHFIEKVCRAEEIPVQTLGEDALERLCAHSWPGNVRELENAVEMGVALSGNRRSLGAADFPLSAGAHVNSASWSAAPMPLVALPDDGLNYEQTLAMFERSILEQALRKTGGNKKAAAEMLGLKRTTLSAKVRSLEGVACE